jgi:hypothetical protein
LAGTDFILVCGCHRSAQDWRPIDGIFNDLSCQQRLSPSLS